MVSLELEHNIQQRLARGDTGRTRPTPSDSKSHTRLRQDQRPVALAGVVATGPAPPHTLGGQRIHLSHLFRERPGPGILPDPCAVRQTLSGQKPMRNPSAVGLTTTTITSGRHPNQNPPQEPKQPAQPTNSQQQATQPPIPRAGVPAGAIVSRSANAATRLLARANVPPGRWFIKAVPRGPWPFDPARYGPIPALPGPRA